MPVLYAISILAFVALLWAAISMVGAVRRARRRREQRASGAADPASATVRTDAAPPPMPGPPRLRSFPTRLGNHPAAAGTVQRGEWNPFAAVNQDFADLTDPMPGGRRLKPPPRRRNSTDQKNQSDRAD